MMLRRFGIHINQAHAHVLVSSFIAGMPRSASGHGCAGVYNTSYYLSPEASVMLFGFVFVFFDLLLRL